MPFRPAVFWRVRRLGARCRRHQVLVYRRAARPRYIRFSAASQLHRAERRGNVVGNASTRYSYPGDNRLRRLRLQYCSIPSDGCAIWVTSRFLSMRNNNAHDGDSTAFVVTGAGNIGECGRLSQLGSG